MTWVVGYWASIWPVKIPAVILLESLMIAVEKLRECSLARGSHTELAVIVCDVANSSLRGKVKLISDSCTCFDEIFALYLEFLAIFVTSFDSSLIYCTTCKWERNSYVFVCLLQGDVSVIVMKLSSLWRFVQGQCEVLSGC